MQIPLLKLHITLPLNNPKSGRQTVSVLSFVKYTILWEKDPINLQEVLRVECWYVLLIVRCTYLKKLKNVGKRCENFLCSIKIYAVLP